MGKSRLALAGVALAGFGVAMALTAVELGVRGLHLVPEKFWDRDPLLGRRLIAGKEGWWTQEDHEFIVPVRINSQGRRDVERRAEKPPGVSRVLLLGDSFVEALQVPRGETVGRQLEARLNEGTGEARTEVVTMGVSGYGTASQYLYYRKSGRLFAPDVVLLAFYPGNDVRNNSPVLESVLRPAYNMEGGLERVLPNHPKPARHNGGRHSLLQSSQAYRYIRKLILTKHRTLAARLVDLGLLKPQAVRQATVHNGIPIDYWVYASDPPREWEEAWQYTEGLLDALEQEVRADGGRLALMIVTSRDHVYAEAWQQVLAAHPGMDELEWDLEAPERRILAWCARTRVPCLQLSQVFRERRNGGPRLHFHHDGHWTAAGHALAAEKAAAFLRAAQVLPAATEEKS